MSEKMIVTDGLSKQFEDLWAVRELDLEIPEGEFFAFLGPNGAGKTTTIKMLTGLIRPTEGKALIAGFDVQTHPVEAKRLIGYIPDHPYLYEKLTGRDFLYFVGDMFKIPRSRQEESLEKYFTYFELIDEADKLIENYSHGMRQKLVFSVSLMHSPKVIIIDEPMVGLDPKSVKKVKLLLNEQTLNGATVFLSTHTLSVAEELANRIGIINRGRLLFLGSIKELKGRLAHDGSLEDLFLELTEDEETRCNV